MKPQILLFALLLAAPRLYAQAGDIPSGAPAVNAKQTPEQRGRILVDQMVAALGGDAWLNRTSMVTEGRNAVFFRGAPDLGVTEFWESHRFPVNGQTDAYHIELTKKRDVIQVWSTTAGIEITYKGNSPLPKDQVDDTLRRRAHSIEEVVHTWIHAPGVVVVAEGTSTVGRRQTDKVTVLSANNDAVTLELDATTHLPLRRTFEWRNEKFKDHDEDAEEYDDYHSFQGLPTPMNITRYRNGDITSQRYFTKVTYNLALDPALFDPTRPLHKKK